MAREDANSSSDNARDHARLGAALTAEAAVVDESAAPALLRWTLGNLDEAFRSCIAQLETLGDLDFAAGTRAGAAERGLEPGIARDDARFRSCDGPIERDATVAPCGEVATRSDFTHGHGRA